MACFLYPFMSLYMTSGWKNYIFFWEICELRKKLYVAMILIAGLFQWEKIQKYWSDILYFWNIVLYHDLVARCIKHLVRRFEILLFIYCRICGCILSFVCKWFFNLHVWLPIKKKEWFYYEEYNKHRRKKNQLGLKKLSKKKKRISTS